MDTTAQIGLFRNPRKHAKRLQRWRVKISQETARLARHVKRFSTVTLAAKAERRRIRAEIRRLSDERKHKHDLYQDRQKQIANLRAALGAIC